MRGPRSAEKAAALLRPNSTLFLDSGSTATAVARCLPDEPMLIYTSGLTCAAELARLEKPRVALPGGTLNRFSMSVCGIQSVLELGGINFDWFFLGVTSYSPDTGFTCGVEEEARLKQAVLRRAERTAVLLDRSKIGLKSTFHICGLPEVDFIVSDGELPQGFLQACAENGVTVICPPSRTRADTGTHRFARLRGQRQRDGPPDCKSRCSGSICNNMQVFTGFLRRKNCFPTISVDFMQFA